MPKTDKIPSFEDWYDLLALVARDHGVSVADVEAWREVFDQGLCPWTALIDEYPDLEEDDVSPVSASSAEWSAETVANEIGMPLSDWPGNCYAIACKMVKEGLAMGRAVYGHYLGPVHHDSMFYGKPIIQHGWIETPDGLIIDPTRWVFEDSAPYIFESAVRREEYDEGGNVMFLQRERPVPDHDPEERSVEITVEHRPLVSALLSRPEEQERLGIMEAHWLATLSLIRLGEKAKPLYSMLVDAGLSALIPIDNRMKILGVESDKI